jgi:hypothetical protein
MIRTGVSSNVDAAQLLGITSACQGNFESRHG